MSLLPVALVTGGLALTAASIVALRLAGGHPGLALRLAGPREATVAAVLEDPRLARRPVRIAGRVRCSDPLIDANGQRLVVLHRDVELRLDEGWRAIERVREGRSFELWDRGGSLTVDPARVAEPVIAIPSLWRGPASALSEPLASSAARVAERDGAIHEARAVTRAISVTDHLLVVARPTRGLDGTVRLEPPSGGYLISNLALPAAMRLLGGVHRRVAAASIIGVILGATLTAAGGLGALGTLVGP